MKLLFVKGDRGLVANMDGKFYFPDRKSNIKEEGLYDCRVTVEKDKYSFVDGEEIKTYLPSSDQIADSFRTRIKMNKYNTINDYITMYDFMILKIGKSFICYERDIYNCNFINLIYYDYNKYEKKHEILTITSYINPHTVYVPNGNHVVTSAMRELYAWDKFEEYISKSDIINMAIKNLSNEIDPADFNKVISYILCDRYYEIKEGSWAGTVINKIDVFSNMYFVFDITYNPGFIKPRNYKMIYSILSNNKIFRFCTNIENYEFDNVDDYGDPCYTINFNDIITYMYDNKIGRHTMNNYDEEWCQNLIVNNIQIMNSSVEVLYLDGSKLLKTEYTEEEIKKANASFERISSTRKLIGKNVTKSNIDELKKLTPQNIIGF